MRNEVYAAMFDHSVRAETVLHLPSMLYVTEAFSSQVMDVFNEDFYHVMEALGLNENDIAEDSDVEEIADFLKRSKCGEWLVQFATPIPMFTDGDSDSYSFTWGQYATKWMSGDDYPQLCRKAIEWAEHLVEHRRKIHLARNEKS